VCTYVLVHMCMGLSVGVAQCVFTCMCAGVGTVMVLRSLMPSLHNEFNPQSNPKEGYHGSSTS
jgi:hypothetical protein